MIHPYHHSSPSRRSLRAVATVLLSVGLLGAASAPANASPYTFPSGLQVEEPTVDFGPVKIGAHAETSIFVTNASDSAITIDHEDVDYQGPTPVIYGDGDFPRVLEPGDGARVELRFTPSYFTSGSYWSAYNVYTSPESAPAASITVRGTGVGGVEATPTSIDFGTLSATAPATRQITLSNPGLFTEPIHQDWFAGPLGEDGPDNVNASAFTFSGDLTSPLDPGEKRVITVTLRPSHPGETFEADAVAEFWSKEDTFKQGAYATVQLTGTRKAPTAARLMATPTSLQFGDVWVGSKATKTFTLKNTGETAAPVGAALAGAAAGRYTVSGAPASLAAGASKVVTVTFLPSARGAAPASLKVGSLSVPITGKGIAPTTSYSATTLAFGTVARGKTLARTVIVKNTGDANLSFNSVKLAGTAAASYTLVGNTTALAPGASRTFAVTFKPTTTGAKPATLAFSTNAIPYAPVNVALTGTGS